MLILFAVGTMSLLSGAAITRFVVAEKVLPGPRVLVWTGGAICLVGGRAASTPRDPRLPGELDSLLAVGIRPLICPEPVTAAAHRLRARSSSIGLQMVRHVMVYKMPAYGA